MSDDSIREAAISDSEMIAHIHVESSKAGYQDVLAFELLQRRTESEKTSYWAKLLGESQGTTLLYEINNSPVAFIRTVRNPEFLISEISHLFVLSALWGRGIAEKLLKASLEPAIRRTELWVLKGNNQAENFYKSKGFEESGLSRPYDFEGVPVKQVQYFRNEGV